MASETIPKMSPFRAYWRLASGYFSGERGWLRRGAVAALLALSVAQTYVQVRINLWNADFFNALERKAVDDFIGHGLLFFVWLGLSASVSMAQLHLRMHLQVGWRRWLTRKMLKNWVASGRHYLLNFVPGDHDNPDQRIAEDVRVATETAVDFSIGLFDNLLLLVSFVGILWVISGTLMVSLGGAEFGIPGYMVWAALFYALAGSVAAYFLGRPQILLQHERREREAELRFRLIHVREASEGIALLRGEEDERHDLDHALKDVVRVWRRLIANMRAMAGLSASYYMLAGVFPIAIASPRYFSGMIALGGLMQIVGAFGQVQSALSYFFNNMSRYSEWTASVQRVAGLDRSLAGLDAQATSAGSGISVTANAGTSLRLRKLDVAYPDGTVVVNGAHAEVKPGERVLLIGESGAGKSTLVRALAGLWPWGRGSVELPPDSTFMFLPQRPYMPLGTLWLAVTYPAAEDAFDEATLKAALTRCGLAGLTGRLAETQRWDRVLSSGELQRVALARLLLHKPDWIVLDEALSTFEAATRGELMDMLRAELPGATVVSATHAPGLEAFHDRVVTLVRGADGARLATAEVVGTVIPGATVRPRPKHQAPRIAGGEKRRKPVAKRAPTRFHAMPDKPEPAAP